MTQREASYCPYCGTSLETRVSEGRERTYCPDCEEVVYRNPVPGAHVVVLAGRSVLLIERAIEPDRGKWAVPGGILEHDEPPAVGAARELEEETGLAVAPDALELVSTGFDADRDGGRSYLSVCFAVDRERTRGRVRPGDEASGARFWGEDERSDDTDRIRPVDHRRIAAALAALRGADRPD